MEAFGDTPFGHRPRAKPAGHDSRDREIRIGHPNPSVVLRLPDFAAPGLRRLCLAQLGSVLAIAQEAQLFRARLRQRRNCRDRSSPVSDILAPHEINDFSERNGWHGSECIGSPWKNKGARRLRCGTKAAVRRCRIPTSGGRHPESRRAIPARSAGPFGCSRPAPRSSSCLSPWNRALLRADRSSVGKLIPRNDGLLGFGRRRSRRRGGTGAGGLFSLARACNFS